MKTFLNRGGVGGADGKGGGAWVTVVKVKGETPQIKRGGGQQREGGVGRVGPSSELLPQAQQEVAVVSTTATEDSRQGAEPECGSAHFQSRGLAGRVRKRPSPSSPSSSSSSSSPPPRLPGHNLTSSGAEQPRTPGGELAPAAANHSQALSQQQDL